MYVVMIPSGLLGGSHSTINVPNMSPVVTVTFSGTVGTDLETIMNLINNSYDIHLHAGVVKVIGATSPDLTVTALTLTT